MTEKTEVDIRHEPQNPSTHVWDPLTRMRQQFERIFQDADWPDFRLPFRRPASAELSASLPWFGASLPAVDLVEREGEYEVRADLPGFDAHSIEVKLTDSILTIRADRSSERVEDKDDYHLRERESGMIRRSFRLPSGVATDAVTARYENGVLKVTMPKTAEAREKERKIEVQAA
ncbi:Hsp20/alpha crystallin family protein [Cereibacter sphaeroides]|uniref:Hsp20/alpha crystallin family protein n=1 Tax=Cereibacter sphaeroides TaxID=1063 RepID=UPI001F1F75C3|nr:Hsp20/alpha crystallin family protein [Cereibacter sphaeroides]MCE6967254.1 Hsp20/alpha crystallin family protein [Cereibacter sphaeroides]